MLPGGRPPKSGKVLPVFIFAGSQRGLQIEQAKLILYTVFSDGTPCNTLY